MTIYDLYNADEVFLTANHIDVIPVKEIDGRKISDDTPGPITRKLQKLYLKWCVDTGTQIT
jgi:branched-subunit amino acid aminotransferase/4-amino-4-deoxychorismate lyase